MKNLISDEAKTQTMKNREKRIERLKQEIKEIEKKIIEEEKILEEEYNRVVNRELSSLSTTFLALDIDITLDELIKQIKNGEIEISKINKHSNKHTRAF